MKSLRFFSLNDLLVSVVPAILTIYSTLINLAVWVSILAGSAVLLTFIVFSVRKNIAAYKKELAEILANGYFINFMENLSMNLNEKDNEIEVENRLQTYDLKHIEVEIHMPRSKVDLGNKADEINDSDNYKRINIKSSKNNSGFWVRAREVEGKLIIVDFPRTLYSISKYIALELGRELTEKQSVKYFQTFSRKIKRLQGAHHENRILSHFKIIS